MSNAFDKASLVMLPHAYEEGKLYSLKPTDRGGDFTFSRGTDTATRVNEQGYIEKETQNLLTYSNDFGNSAWVKSDVSVTGGQTGYDGSSDAWLLENTGNSGRIFQSPSPAGVYTISVYAKAGNVDLIWINIGGGVFGAYFDLSGSGSVRSTQSLIGGKTIKASIESIGSGWFRCVVAGYFNQANNYRIYPSAADGDSGASTGANIYIQDAQLNQGLVAQPYLETTTAPVYGGLTDNMPRLDYTDASCPSLLLEPSRTNLVSGSEYLEQFWGGNSTRVYNQITSPEGVENSTKIYPSSTGSFRGINKTFGSSLSNTPYTLSVFAKASEFEYLTFYNIGSPDGNNGVWFNLTSGSVETTQPAWTSAKIENFGNGWYRCSAVITPGGSADYLYILLTDSNGSIIATANGTDGLYIYGTQLEEGSYPTSYIPTYGSTQTRSRDSATASVTNTTSRTYFLDGKRLADEDVNNSSPIYNATGTLRITCWTDNRFRFRFLNDSDYYTLVGDDFKIAVSYNGVDSKVFINGSYWITKTLDLGNLSTIDIVGNEGVSYNQILLFPTALSDAECIALTQN